jgi:hypothetical protein
MSNPPIHITLDLNRLLIIVESVQRRSVLQPQEIVRREVERPAPRIPVDLRNPLTTTRPRKIKIKVRALAKADINARMDTCAICLEQHTKIDSVLTSCCNHSFGNECLKGWQKINPKCPCPACRNPTFSLTAFRPRKTRAIVP